MHRSCDPLQTVSHSILHSASSLCGSTLLLRLAARLFRVSSRCTCSSSTQLSKRSTRWPKRPNGTHRISGRSRHEWSSATFDCVKWKFLIATLVFPFLEANSSRFSTASSQSCKAPSSEVRWKFGRDESFQQLSCKDAASVAQKLHCYIARQLSMRPSTPDV